MILKKSCLTAGFFCNIYPAFRHNLIKRSDRNAGFFFFYGIYFKNNMGTGAAFYRPWNRRCPYFCHGIFSCSQSRVHYKIHLWTNLSEQKSFFRNGNRPWRNGRNRKHSRSRFCHCHWRRRRGFLDVGGCFFGNDA